MTNKTKTDIKAFFELGDKPTQSQFVDLIDSYVDKSGPVGTLETACSAGTSGFVLLTSGSAGTTNFATTAVAQAGTDASTVMSPVLVKNAISSIGASQTVLLATKTASNSASLDFTSLISSSYNQYLLVIKDLLTSTTASINLKASANNGSSWAATLDSQKAALTLGGTTAPSYTGVGSSTPALLTTSQASDKYTGYINICSGPNMTLYKSFIGCNAVSVTSVWETTITATGSALYDAFQLIPSAGTFTSGTAYLFATKNT